MCSPYRQNLAATEHYLAVLHGHPAKFPAGERFCYRNAGYVVPALIAERVSGTTFRQLVQERVCAPGRHGGHRVHPFWRTPDRTALAYLTVAGRSRTNVFHLPVLGSRDDGIYSTAADITAFWQSLFTGKDRSCRLGGGNGAGP